MKYNLKNYQQNGIPLTDNQGKASIHDQSSPKMYRNDGFHPIKKVFLLGK